MVFTVAQGATVDARGVVALPLAVWWLLPQGIFLWRCKTRLGAVIIGGGYSIAVVGLMIGLYRDDSSTAGIGYVTIPLLLWMGVGAGLGLERVGMKRTAPRVR